MSINQSHDRGSGAGSDSATALSILKQRFGDHLSTAHSVREQHGHTTTSIKNQPPDAVVFAETESDVVDLVAICATHKFPVIPFGTGTSLEGQVNAPNGGVSVDLSAMNEIVEVSNEDLYAVVQPGVQRKQLNSHLRDSGLFFPIDPGADASLGGMAATRASGTNAVRYGTMRDNIISLRAVLPNGKTITTASRAKKSSAGYDLTRLMIGSEGTLGIITELTLKLSGIPEVMAAAVCGFGSVDGACQTTMAAIQMGLPVARIELLDAAQVRACNAYSNLQLDEQPTLFLEFHGSAASVKEQTALFGELAEEFGGTGYKWAEREEERTQLWQARHDAYWSVLNMMPGKKAVATDACVPISRLADCIAETTAEIESEGLTAPIVGHVGDGNFHTTLMIDMNDAAEVAKAEAFIGRLAKRAIAMGGTCTGEHGIGQGKMPYLEAELGAPAVEMMQTIKQAVDPDNIFNPGKIFAI